VYLPPRISPLVRIKLLHTAVWLFFVACIVGIPFAVSRENYRWVGILTALVLLECAVLLLNRGRCPLTDMASRHTNEQADNFDIYLPLWLARYNKIIFGTLFVVEELWVLERWIFGHR
jgi:hypothetical protein